MSQDEKRALEIYISLIIQYIRKENDRALEHLRAFFYSFNFMQNYDPELLYNTCIQNIEIIEKIPSHGEILMTATVRTKRLDFNFSSFKLFYKKKLNSEQLHQKQFSKENILLLPKINTLKFHSNLLTFLQNFAILGKSMPIKLHKR